MKTVDQSGWVPGGFSVKHESGAPGATAAKEELVAGWLKPPLALDFRAVLQEDFSPDEIERQSAWALTHLPTGCAVTAIFGTIEEARLVADEIARIGDWSFQDPKPGHDLKLAFSAYKKARGSILIAPERTIPPWHRLTQNIGPVEQAA